MNYGRFPRKVDRWPFHRFYCPANLFFNKNISWPWPTYKKIKSQLKPGHSVEKLQSCEFSAPPEGLGLISRSKTITIYKNRKEKKNGHHVEKKMPSLSLKTKNMQEKQHSFKPAMTLLQSTHAVFPKYLWKKRRKKLWVMNKYMRHSQ